MHYTYIEWQLLLAGLPTLILWLFYWRLLSNYTKVFIYCIVGSVVFATPWDYWATHSWLWHFSSALTVNKRFLGLPLEEYMFFVVFTLMYASIALVLRDKLMKKGSKR
jgi:lycopene cyclase domain-containing protein